MSKASIGSLCGALTTIWISLKDWTIAEQRGVYAPYFVAMQLAGIPLLLPYVDRAVLARDLNRCIELGGNIYYLAKIGATDGKSFQQIAAEMTGMSQDDYAKMMLSGGRSIDGCRSTADHG